LRAALTNRIPTDRESHLRLAPLTLLPNAMPLSRYPCQVFYHEVSVSAQAAG
jgi:hypothetical protein